MHLMEFRIDVQISFCLTTETGNRYLEFLQSANRLIHPHYKHLIHFRGNKGSINAILSVIVS